MPGQHQRRPIRQRFDIELVDLKQTIKLPDKPGLGIELNADVVKAHLAAGETYWG